MSIVEALKTKVNTTPLMEATLPDVVRYILDAAITVHFHRLAIDTTREIKSADTPIEDAWTTTSLILNNAVIRGDIAGFSEAANVLLRALWQRQNPSQSSS